MARRRNHFQFTGKSHSKKGIAVFAMSVILLVLFLVFVSLAYQSVGNLSLYFGGWGVIALFVSLFLIVFGIQSLREEDSFPLFPRLGLLLAVLSFLAWGFAYLLGLGILS